MAAMSADWLENDEQDWDIYCDLEITPKSVECFDLGMGMHLTTHRGNRLVFRGKKFHCEKNLCKENTWLYSKDGRIPNFKLRSEGDFSGHLKGQSRGSGMFI